MLSISSSQIKKQEPVYLKYSNYTIKWINEYGCKQTCIVNLPKGNYSGEFWYQLDMAQLSEKHMQQTLYILKGNCLSMFRNHFYFQEEDQLNSSSMDQEESMSETEYQIKEWTGKNKDQKPLNIKLGGKDSLIGIIQNEKDATFPRDSKLKTQQDFQQFDNGFQISSEISLNTKQVKIGFEINFDGQPRIIENLMLIEQPKEVNQQQQEEIQVSEFPSLSHSHKKGKITPEQLHSPVSTQNNQFNAFCNTSLFNEIVESLSTQSQQDKAHNLRKKRIPNYQNLGQEEEDDSTCENSSDNTCSPSDGKKKQRSRKSSYSSQIYQQQMKDQNQDNQTPATLVQIQQVQSAQYPSIINFTHSKKPSPLKNFSNMNSHIEEEDSYTQFSSSAVSHKSSASKQKKGDKKNVVKNYTKAFSKFIFNDEYAEIVKSVLPENTDAYLQNFRAQWKEFFNRPKFNNKLIKELILNKKWHDAFDLFLQKYAQEWLMTQSSVEDKESHLEVLSDYIKASNKPEDIENIVILKCRN